MALQLKIKNHPIELIDNYFNGEARINDLRRPGSKDGLGEVHLHVGQSQWPDVRSRNLAFVETLSCQYPELT